MGGGSDGSARLRGAHAIRVGAARARRRPDLRTLRATPRRRRRRGRRSAARDRRGVPLRHALDAQHRVRVNPYPIYVTRIASASELSPPSRFLTVIVHVSLVSPMGVLKRSVVSLDKTSCWLTVMTVPLLFFNETAFASRRSAPVTVNSLGSSETLTSFGSTLVRTGAVGGAEGGCSFVDAVASAVFDAK